MTVLLIRHQHQYLIGEETGSEKGEVERKVKDVEKKILFMSCPNFV